MLQPRITRIMCCFGHPGSACHEPPLALPAHQTATWARYNAWSAHVLLIEVRLPGCIDRRPRVGLVPFRHHGPATVLSVFTDR